MSSDGDLKVRTKAWLESQIKEGNALSLIADLDDSIAETEARR